MSRRRRERKSTATGGGLSASSPRTTTAVSVVLVAVAQIAKRREREGRQRETPSLLPPRRAHALAPGNADSAAAAGRAPASGRTVRTGTYRGVQPRERAAAILRAAATADASRGRGAALVRGRSPTTAPPGRPPRRSAGPAPALVIIVVEPPAAAEEIVQRAPDRAAKEAEPLAAEGSPPPTLVPVVGAPSSHRHPPPAGLRRWRPRFWRRRRRRAWVSLGFVPGRGRTAAVPAALVGRHGAESPRNVARDERGVGAGPADLDELGEGRRPRRERRRRREGLPAATANDAATPPAARAPVLVSSCTAAAAAGNPAARAPVLVSAAASTDGPQNERLPHGRAQGGGNSGRAHDAPEQLLSARPGERVSPGPANRLARRQGPQAAQQRHRLGEELRHLAGQGREVAEPGPSPPGSLPTALICVAYFAAVTAETVTIGTWSVAPCSCSGTAGGAAAPAERAPRMTRSRHRRGSCRRRLRLPHPRRGGRRVAFVLLPVLVAATGVAGCCRRRLQSGEASAAGAGFVAVADADAAAGWRGRRRHVPLQGGECVFFGGGACVGWAEVGSTLESWLVWHRSRRKLVEGGGLGARIGGARAGLICFVGFSYAQRDSGDKIRKPSAWERSPTKVEYCTRQADEVFDWAGGGRGANLIPRGQNRHDGCFDTKRSGWAPRKCGKIDVFTFVGYAPLQEERGKGILLQRARRAREWW